MEIGSNPVTDILIVLAIFVAIVAFLFITFRIWGYFMRFFKEESHHPQKQHKPLRDKNHIPIDFEQYDSYLFLKDISSAKIIEIFNEYVDEEELTKEQIDNIAMSSDEAWYSISFKNFNYDDYMDIATFFTSEIVLSEGHPINSAYGFCKHKENDELDFVFSQSENYMPHYLMGVFRTDRNFTIDTQNIDENRKGNLSLSNKQDLHFTTTMEEFPQAALHSKKVKLDEF